MGQLDVFDEDNDTLSFLVTSGNRLGYFDVAPMGVHPTTLLPRFGLFLSDRVVGEGDGTGYTVMNGVTTKDRAGDMSVDPLLVDYEDETIPRTLIVEVLTYHNATFKQGVAEEWGDRSNSARVTIAFQDRNDPPRLQPPTLHVPENSLVATRVGNRITASDQDTLPLTDGSTDRSDAHTYAWGLGAPGDVTDLFDLASDGTVTISAAGSGVLDFESRNLYLAPITVTDSGGVGGLWPSRSLTVNLTIAVADVNEAPTISDGDFYVDENSDAGTVIGLVNAMDPDAGDNITFSILDGDSDNLFAVLPTREIVVAR